MFLLKYLRRLVPRSSKTDTRIAKAEWKVLSTVSGLLTGLLVRKILNVLWAKFSPSDHQPPLNPADRRIGWGEAIAWSVSAGAGVGVARVVSDRLAAKGWELAVGEPPPGIVTD